MTREALQVVCVAQRAHKLAGQMPLAFPACSLLPAWPPSSRLGPPLAARIMLSICRTPRLAVVCGGRRGFQTGLLMRSDRQAGLSVG